MKKRKKKKLEKRKASAYSMEFVLHICPLLERGKKRKKQKIELCELSDTTVIKALTPFSLEIEKRLDKDVYSIKI